MRDDEIEIHPKSWGEEHWIVNKGYCGKRLVLRRGHRCSIQWHEIKDEVFYVLSGVVLVEVNGESRVLHPGMKQYIRPRDKHRLTGLSDSEIMEFSTTHMEDDSYRDAPSDKVPEDEFHELEKRYLKAVKKVSVIS